MQLVTDVTEWRGTVYGKKETDAGDCEHDAQSGNGELHDKIWTGFV